MKLTTPAALWCAGLLFSNALLAQDAPADPAPSAPEPKPATPPAPEPTPATPPPAPDTAPPAPQPATPPPAAEPEKPKLDPATMKRYASYGFGFRNGSSFAGQTGRFGLNLSDIDREEFLKGLFDAMELRDSSIDQDKINDALSQLSEVIKEREARIAEENKAAGENFLAENKKREGVITTESGLQYEILEAGQGTVHAAPADGTPPSKQYMTVYRGTLIDGTEFDSSKGQPAPMNLNVIPGFKEALTSMPVGSKWKLFIPSELAYGESRRSAKLGPNSTLIFELDLKEVTELPQPPSRPGALPGQPGTRPGAVSPPVRVPPQPGRPDNGARAVSPPVRVPNPNDERPRARAVSPPVRIPTNPLPKQDPQPESQPAPAPDPAPEEQPK